MGGRQFALFSRYDHASAISLEDLFRDQTQARECRMTACQVDSHSKTGGRFHSLAFARPKLTSSLTESATSRPRSPFPERRRLLKISESVAIRPWQGCSAVSDEPHTGAESPRKVESRK
jgi:hypothetical protein